MTKLDCAIELLGFLCKEVSVNGAVAMDKTEAVARAIMELGRGERADVKEDLGGLIMTPEEFAKRAQKIYDENEGFAGENGHIDMDRLMIECLESLGYEDGCDILFSMTSIWYA